MARKPNSKHQKSLATALTRTVICSYCQKPAQLEQGSYGFIWKCSPCKARVGTHANSPTHEPLGTLANSLLRSWRSKAHATFDPLWKAKIERDNVSRSVAREAGYQWLAKQMGLKKRECHIARFNVSQCMRCVEICSPYHRRIRASSYLTLARTKE